ncbi:MAG: preprotein translocase subunit SecA [Rikenellaceae bacterium]
MANIVGGLLGLLFGTKVEKDRKAVMPYVDNIKKFESEMLSLSNDELRGKTLMLKDIIAKALEADRKEIVEMRAMLEDASLPISKKEQVSKDIDKKTKDIDNTIEAELDKILPEAFAIIKETARRFKENETIVVSASDADRELTTKKDFVTIDGDKAIYKTSWSAGGNLLNWDMVHYDSQLFGGVVLHQGKIAEMATGEGKTLVSTLPIYLNALTGLGVHVVTVNDYLAKRDCEWMGPIFEFHGLTVDCIDNHQPNSVGRKKAYMADVTYGTNNEFGFDYLRDNMATSAEELVQRKHQYAIVDEVDSVLIDDARTPLIISGPVPKGDDQLFDEYKPSVSSLYALQKNYVTSILVDAKKLIAEGNTEEGGKLLYRAHKGLPKYTPLIKFLSEQGNKTLMQKIENEFMSDSNKRMPEITNDLYFVIDEKINSVDLTDKGLDKLSEGYGDAEFFILPEISSRLAKIENDPALTEEQKQTGKSEVMAEYSLKSERIHTISQLLKAYSLFEKDIEYVVVENKVKIVDEQTGRIMEGRRYSDGLHQAIEAKENVTVEAATQTFATVTLQNFFRMYHKLSGMTGTAETEASEFWNIYKLDVVVIPTNRPVIRNDKQDLVYKTKREKYAAVIGDIEKLVKEGRPVLVGTTSVEVSELLGKMLKMRGIPHNVLNAKQHMLEAQIVREAGQSGQVTIATNMAGRGTDIKLSEEVKVAGGLAIIGTERHESRRVDRQLRGRSGRQGDPGSSQFFVSFEDNLMRLFGSDRVMRMTDRMGLEEGEALQAGMMTKAIERAQKKVEENNFGTRKHLLQYDDVMNSQREVIYSRRRSALYGDRLEVDVNNMIADYAITFVRANRDLSLDDFNLELIKELSIKSPFTEKQYESDKDDDLADMLADEMFKSYKTKGTSLAKMLLPFFKTVKEGNPNVNRIAFPFTDGIKGFNVPIDIDRAIDSEGASIFSDFSKIMLLHIIDENWKEHLRDMDDLRQSVQNATYEQKDPLLIYKFESFELFSVMLEKINRETLSLLLKVYVNARQEEPQHRPAQTRGNIDVEKQRSIQREVAMKAGRGGEAQKTMPIEVGKKVGRNEPCPCGSGKKYKQCHGR